MSCIATVCDDADDMLLYQRVTVQNSLNSRSYSDTPCAFKKTVGLILIPHVLSRKH